jgi:hypothetical protein
VHIDVITWKECIGNSSGKRQEMVESTLCNVVAVIDSSSAGTQNKRFPREYMRRAVKERGMGINSVLLSRDDLKVDFFLSSEVL